MKNKVSIIVPIYNTSQYLKNCLETLVNQTYHNIQIILVNDGSTDHSLEICKEFADKDDRIIIVDKKNEGLERARRSGYVYADGEWILHVDSDDYLPVRTIELYMKHVDEQVDIIIGSWYRVIDKKGFIKKKYSLKPMSIENPRFMEEFYSSFFGNYQLPVNVWGKLYRKEILDKAAIKEVKLCFGEDVCYNLQVFPYARKVLTISDVVYNYRWGGMTERMNYKMLTDSKTAFRMKCEMVKKYRITDGLQTTAIEMKEFFCKYMELYALFTAYRKDEIVEICKNEWDSEEIQYTKAVLEDLTLTVDEKTSYFMNGDMSMLYDEITKDILKKKIRRKVIGMIQKVLF